LQTGIESAQDAETERRILRLDTDAAQAEVDRINVLIANGGIVAAPVDGTIIEALIKPGQVASGAVFRIALDSSGMIARAPVSNDQWPHLRTGMQANAQRQGEARGKGVVATISELVPSASGYEAVFELSDSAWPVGQPLDYIMPQMMSNNWVLPQEQKSMSKCPEYSIIYSSGHFDTLLISREKETGKALLTRWKRPTRKL